MNRSERSSIFVEEIWQWYARHKRKLPWRDLCINDDTQRAYQIMVSEIMLQQTQVERVKIVYKDFLNRFPSIKDLSSASNKDIILAWRGMGYNNRALRLRDAAQQILKYEKRNTKNESSDFDIRASGFPKGIRELQSLPGIGHYTAAAIRNFAFNLPTPCIDTNIRRILHRVFIGPENADGTWKKSDRDLLKIAGEVLDIAVESGDTQNWHAALMDFGSLVCTKRSPKWDICPLTQKGIMKAAYMVPKYEIRNTKTEPGRMVGSKHIPNRIFRGKVVEELRDSSKGLTIPEIGRRVCIDWDESEHMQWLESIITALKKDHLIQMSGKRLVLAD
ncbi:MAG: hypothetical protein QF793_03800 [Candidatus Peribacteraceae bacterium]|jgi:A/G-specific adenine glycosylase|nr:hypothetical protein [Candidatus Peribacteraceae bacterium]|tara:strand:+ start:5714 stop:6712 length:999 start_codon:yes stop_codon:yes gene_type:complete